MTSCRNPPTIYFSVKEAARCASVSERTMRRAISAGVLRAYRVTRRLVRIAEPDLKAFVERRPVRRDKR